MTSTNGATPVDPVTVDLPTGEQLRLAALYRYGILDTPPEPQFDRLVKLAAHLFDVPIALISFVGEDRQWFKANQGMPFSETLRCESFCAVTIEQQGVGVMVIPDVDRHEQFRTYPVVLGEPYIRSYAGAPLVTPDGQKIGTFCVLSNERRMFTEKEQELLSFFAEMTMAEVQRRLDLQDLNETAMRDELTGLPNRVQFRQQLIKACRRADTSGEKVGVGLLDLDGFKKINDTFGHAAGDHLLLEVARRLKETTTTGDVVARLSGDEFVLLLTDVQSVENVSLVTKRLEESFAEPFVVEDQEVFMHWSLGWSVYPDDAHEIDALLGLADAAMYRVKRAGGGHATFQRPEDQRSKVQEERLGALHRAFEQDELQLYFQPIVRAEDHVPVAHEALLHWVKPSGVVNSLDFIPLAESSGLIVPIGRWVLRQAVEALKSERLQEVCVNVSALEIRQPHFMQYLRRVLEEAGVEPQRLWLELTESSMLEARFSTVLHEVRALNVRTALDDFGHGYSSVMALASLPVQMVKIDRSFTAGIGEDTPAGHESLDSLHRIVALATTYRLPTVAEGVETLEQADLLTKAGCTYLQGHFFGRPEPLF